MAQQASKYQCCFQAQLFHFWFSFPVNAPGRTANDGSDTNVGDKDTAPGKAPGAEANMEVNQWIAPPTYHYAISTNQSGKRENSERNCQLYCLIHNLNSRNNINMNKCFTAVGFTSMAPTAAVFSWGWLHTLLPRNIWAMSPDNLRRGATGIWQKKTDVHKHPITYTINLVKYYPS